ncbi:MAG: sodium:proton antiporter [Rhizobiales bacterium]|nr:sodium:proton antiporter [Hyphomicrobiales bacterium]NRB14650.1 sodium:proton antiporter [Hyphomicrobiales bacterium]
MSLLEILALLLGLSALFGYINHRFFKLPHSIGLMIMALLASGIIVSIDYVLPQYHISATIKSALVQIDFHDVVMNGMLSVLLFAGAVHVDLSDLAERKYPIALMASVGLLISTFFIGTSVFYVLQWAGFGIPYIWALLFGALISPTDPVAVLGILKAVSIPKGLKAKITGESLFNDGIGVVVFVILLSIAAPSSGHSADISVLQVAIVFAQEAIGGAVLGIVGGYIAFYAMRKIDEHNIEVMITLALVAGIYAIAIRLHTSGPLAVVVAGLFIGNHGARFAMSENTRKHVFQFWELLDEIFNSILFLLIGLEILIIAAYYDYLLIALITIPIVLLGRFIGVVVPINVLKLNLKFSKGAVRFLTWGGLRGGISVALVLSLPDNEYKPILLMLTYITVLFSIIVQGLSIAPLARYVAKLNAPQIAEIKNDEPSGSNPE